MVIRAPQPPTIVAQAMHSLMAADLLGQRRAASWDTLFGRGTEGGITQHGMAPLHSILGCHAQDTWLSCHILPPHPTYFMERFALELVVKPFPGTIIWVRNYDLQSGVKVGARRLAKLGRAAHFNQPACKHGA